MNQTDAARAFWNKADSKQAGRIIVGGLFVGVIMRWLVISTPTLSVTAKEADQPNTPAPITHSASSPKTGDASPSVPD